ncbi:transposable element Tcb1 transposase [Trichonephila clavipes]|nr:transposable element Tcb1 transposase [Trichonephila clavipes]
MNIGYVYSIKIVPSEFDDIMVNVHWQRHPSPPPGVMVRVVIGYTSRLPLVYNDGTLNSVRYVSGVLRLVVLSIIRVLRNFTLQQDNERLHAAVNVRTFFDTKNVQLLSWPARSPDISPVENVLSMVAERLSRDNTPVTMVDELLHRVEAA